MTTSVDEQPAVVQLAVDGRSQSAVLIASDRVLTVYLGERGSSLVDWQKAGRSQVCLHGERFALDPRACLISNRRAGWSIIGVEPVPSVAPLPLPVTEPWPVEEGQQLHVVSSSSTSWTVSVVETSASGIVKCRCSAGALPSDAPGGAVFSEQWEWVGLLTGTAGDGTLEAVTIKSLVQRLRKRDQWQEASGSSGAGMALLAEKSSGADGPASHPQVVSASIVAMLIMLLPAVSMAVSWALFSSVPLR